MPRAFAVALLLGALAACGEGEHASPAARLVCEAGCTADGAVSLGAVGTGARAIEHVVIANRGDAPATLRTAVQARDLLPFQSDLACDPACPARTVAPGERVEVAIGFRPTALGEQASSLDLGPIALELRGIGTAPTVSCSPAQLGFGTVPVGISERRTIACTNHGPNPTTLEIDEPVAAEAPAYFDVELEGGRDRTLLLEAGATVSFYVAYLPTSPGGHLATLDVRAGREQVAKIMLEGEGVAGALVLEPSEGCVDYGFVAPGASKDLSLLVHNPGERAVTLEDTTVSSEAFAVIDAPSTIAPGASLLLTVRFSPTAVGPQQDTVRLITSGAGTQPSACLQGIGGGPRLSCDTMSLDLGPVPIGSFVAQELHCTSDGWNDQPLLIESLSTTGAFTAEVRGGLPAGGLAVGESAVIDVRFAPGAVGAIAGALTIESNDSGGGIRRVELHGEGQSVPPCDLETSELAFGNVAGRISTLDLLLRNVGETTCVLLDVALDADRFSAEGLERTIEIPAGQAYAIPIRYEPREDAATGSLRFRSDFGAGELATRSVRIAGASVETNLVSAGATFGRIEGTCEAPTATVDLYNPVDTYQNRPARTISAVEAVGAFSISDSVPAFVQGKASVEVTWEPSGRDVDEGALLVWTEEESEPYFVPLHGASRQSATTTERFGGRPVDVLLVGNTSSHPGWFLELLSGVGASFLEHGRTNGVGFQIGLTITQRDDREICRGGYLGQSDGRLFPVDRSFSRMLSSSLPAAEQDLLWEELLIANMCEGHDAGLLVGLQALSAPVVDRSDDPRHPRLDDGNLGFVRSEADLAVVFFSEEEDTSPGDVALYEAQIRRIKGPDRGARAHAFVGSTPGCGYLGARYRQLAAATGGSAESICSADYQAAWSNLGVAVFAPPRCLILSEVPVDTDGAGTASPTFEVKRGGARVAPSAYSWDAEANAVCLRADFAPEPGETIEITYTGSCAAH